MPHEGSRRPADLLRLPGRALGSLANVEPHRECVRNRAAQDHQNQGIAVAGHGPADGLQTRDGRLENLAKAERRKPVAQGRGWCHVPRRERDHSRRPVKPRRLTAPSPKLHHSSVAEQNGVSVGTIRSQTKAIFAKTETNRQAELVGLLTRLALISEDDSSGEASAEG